VVGRVAGRVKGKFARGEAEAVGMEGPLDKPMLKGSGPSASAVPPLPAIQPGGLEHEPSPVAV
jgi:hypothetical protein